MSSVTVNRLRPAILERRVADPAEKLAEMRAFSSGGENLGRLGPGPCRHPVYDPPRPGRLRAKEVCCFCRGSMRPTLRRKASFLSSSEGRSPGRPSTFRVRLRDQGLEP